MGSMRSRHQRIEHGDRLGLPGLVAVSKRSAASSDFYGPLLCYLLCDVVVPCSHIVTLTLRSACAQGCI